MAKRVKPTTDPPVKEEGIRLLAPLLDDYQGLTVTDDESYLLADAFLGRVRNAVAVWNLKMQPILGPAKETVRSAKETLDNARALYEEIAEPLDRLVDGIKTTMRDYKLLEASRERERKAADAREEARLKEEARKREEQAKRAATPQLQQKLVEQGQAFLKRAAAATSAPPPPPVKGASSVARTSRKYRLTDMNEVLVGIAQGVIPLDAVQLDDTYIRKFYGAEKMEAAGWPGFEFYDDVVIAGR